MSFCSKTERGVRAKTTNRNPQPALHTTFSKTITKRRDEALRSRDQHSEGHGARVNMCDAMESFVCHGSRSTSFLRRGGGGRRKIYNTGGMKRIDEITGTYTDEMLTI